MGWLLLAICMAFLTIIGDIQQEERQTARTAWQQQSGQLYATQMLMLANRINDYRYNRNPGDGTLALSLLALPFTPDPRIQHRLVQGRLWVWMPEQPGLVDALRDRSRGSALIGTRRNGQLVWLSGTASGLSAPAGIPDGAVVYLN
jgi:hypothetical protein